MEPTPHLARRTISSPLNRPDQRATYHRASLVLFGVLLAVALCVSCGPAAFAQTISGARLKQQVTNAASVGDQSSASSSLSRSTLPQQPVKCKYDAIEGAPKIQIASSFYSVEGPTTLFLVISIDPKDISRESMTALTRRVKAQFCMEKRVIVAILDNYEAARAWAPTNEKEWFQQYWRGNYFLDRTTNEEWIEFSTMRNRRLDEVRINLASPGESDEKERNINSSRSALSVTTKPSARLNSGIRDQNGRSSNVRKTVSIPSSPARMKATVPRSAIDGSKEAHSPIAARSSEPSSVGINFSSLAPDGKGGVWISGGVLYSGLLLHATPGADPRLVPELRRIDHLSFPTAASGWMVSEGAVYSTQDSIQWKKVEIGKTDELEKVYFFNDRLGWVFGREGVIYRTTDGGRKWRKQNSGTDYDIRQIQFVNPLEGWATAATYKPGDRSDSHVFLSTRDGGDHWTEIPRGKSKPLEAFWFVSDLEGWAVDYDSNIVHTTDRGWTWQVQRSGANSSFASIHFVDSLHGWAAGDGILHTSDGGVTWKYQIDPKGVVGKSSFDLVHFLDAQNGWALDFFHVMFTQDGGKNWQPLAEDWQASTFDKAAKQQEARVNKQNQPN